MEAVTGEKKSSRRFDLITKRRIYWLIVVILAASSLAARYVLRYIHDSRFDLPARYEQVVWMNSWWGFQKDTLKVWLSHLGKPAPERDKVSTQLIGIARDDHILPLAELRRKYLRFSPARISSDNLYVTLASAAKLGSLIESFEALAKAGYASFQAGSFWKPAVYSFAIRARLETSNKIFRRTYHFRTWARGEIALLWVSLALTIYLVTTVSVRGLTALRNNPQRPIDLLQHWSSNFWIALRVWLLRKIVCNRLAESIEWVAQGLGLLAAIAAIKEGAPVANVLGLFTVLTSILARLIAVTRSAQVETLNRMIQEKQSELESKQVIEVREMQELGRLIHEIKALQQLCKDLEPDKLAEPGKVLRAGNGLLRENIKKLRRELKLVYFEEKQRRAALEAAITAKLEETRQRIAGSVLTYLQSAEFRSKIPIFNEMVSEEEFKQKVQDPELVFQGERREQQTNYRLISLRPQIKSALGELLLVLAITKEGPSFRIQQFVDEDHPIQSLTLLLEKRPSQEISVRFEVRFGSMVINPDKTLPSVEEMPVSLANPDPNYLEWCKALPPVRQLLHARL